MGGMGGGYGSVLFFGSTLRSWSLLMGYPHDYRGAMENLCYELLYT
jgi:hypothetical protein